MAAAAQTVPVLGRAFCRRGHHNVAVPWWPTAPAAAMRHRRLSTISSDAMASRMQHSRVAPRQSVRHGGSQSGTFSGEWPGSAVVAAGACGHGPRTSGALHSHDRPSAAATTTTGALAVDTRGGESGTSDRACAHTRSAAAAAAAAANGTRGRGVGTSCVSEASAAQAAGAGPRIVHSGTGQCDMGAVREDPFEILVLVDILHQRGRLNRSFDYAFQRAIYLPVRRVLRRLHCDPLGHHDGEEELLKKQVALGGVSTRNALQELHLGAAPPQKAQLPARLSRGRAVNATPHTIPCAT
eukprot:NODE_9368_length_1429_cov_3.299539.p1 GENE.NODE_9368_length_1429_cov_3.299539~~NODE_9368_length_1429_cov_3.299539.p1  ORF type:complete len:333 (-),score=43.91 NODE_9368_length_1429_cov_3.299539:429-1319(-)